MRTTITLDDDLVEHLRTVTGITELPALVRTALVQMQQREAARRLIAIGASDPQAWAPDEGAEQGR